MKQLLSTFLVALSIHAVSAQINQGTLFVGAASSAGAQSIKVGNSSQTLISLNAKIGYFVAENLVLGPNFTYVEFGSINQTTIGAFGRYYITGKYFLGVGYLSQFSGGSSSNIGYVPIEAGYAAFLTRNIAIEPAVTYTLGTGNASSSSSVGFSVGFSLYFNRK